MIERVWFVVDALTTSVVTLTIGMIFAAFIVTRSLARLLRAVPVQATPAHRSGAWPTVLYS